MGARFRCEFLTYLVHRNIGQQSFGLGGNIHSVHNLDMLGHLASLIYTQTPLQCDNRNLESRTKTLCNRSNTIWYAVSSLVWYLPVFLSWSIDSSSISQRSVMRCVLAWPDFLDSSKCLTMASCAPIPIPVAYKMTVPNSSSLIGRPYGPSLKALKRWRIS